MKQLYRPVSTVFILATLLNRIAVSDGRPLSEQRYLCSPCPPGFEVDTLCTELQDTKCRACSKGTYSNSSDVTPCYPCSRCGDHLFELHKCSQVSDVFCEICTWEKAKDNPDYIKKCIQNYAQKADDNSRTGVNSLDRKNDGRERMVGDQPLEKISEVKANMSKEYNVPEDDINDVKKNSKIVEPFHSEGHVQSDNSKPTNISVKSSNMSTDSEARLITANHSNAESNYQTETTSGTNQSDIVSTENPEGSLQATADDVITPENEADSLVTTEETGSGRTVDDTTVPFGFGNKEDSTTRELTPSTAPFSKTQKTESSVSRSSTFVYEYNQNSTLPKNSSIVVVAAQDINNKPSSEEEANSTFGIVVAAITSGIIFFAVGFLISRKRSDKSKPSKISCSSICSRGHDPVMTWDDDIMCTSLQTGNEMYQELGVVGTEYTEMVVRNRQQELLQSGVPQVAIVPSDDEEKKPEFVGNYQSPVNIDPEEADVDEGLEKNPLFLKYIPENSKSITNNGSLMRIEVDGVDSLLRGGPLNHRYQLDHVHFHWGSSDDRGSEHTVKGMTFAAEVHFVHWNTDLYKSFAEAVKAESGLAIVGVLIEIGLQHRSLKTITDMLSQIRYKGEARDIVGAYFDLSTLLPDNTIDYWTYQGSTTEPPYYESVTWIVFKEPIEVSREQMSAFRELLSYERDEDHGVSAETEEGRILQNYRAPLPLGDRIVKASFT